MNKEYNFVKAFEENNLDYCNDNLDQVNFTNISCDYFLSEKFIETYKNEIGNKTVYIIH